jgi:hypothetical protein
VALSTTIVRDLENGKKGHHPSGWVELWKPGWGRRFSRKNEAFERMEVCLDATPIREELVALAHGT